MQRKRRRSLVEAKQRTSDDDDESSGERDVLSDSRREIDDELDDDAGGAPEESENDDVDSVEEEEPFSDESEALKREEVLVLKEVQNRKDKNGPDVPRIGAFYMHDDCLGRRMRFGGRKLLEFKDERQWKHDKFEGITLKESDGEKVNACTKVHKTSNGFNHGYFGNQDKHNDNYKNQSSSRTMKGRGPVKYKPLNSSSYVCPQRRKK